VSLKLGNVSVFEVVEVVAKVVVVPVVDPESSNFVIFVLSELLYTENVESENVVGALTGVDQIAVVELEAVKTWPVVGAVAA
jgi:hypothetical protein